MKEMTKDTIYEVSKDSKQSNVDDIQELLCNLSIKTKKINTTENETSTNEEENCKPLIVKKELNAETDSDEDNGEERNSENESSDEESQEPFNVLQRANETTASEPQDKNNNDENETEQDSDCDNASEPVTKAEVLCREEEYRTEQNEIDSLKVKLALFDLGDESSEEDDESSYLKRGPLTDHRNNHSRFSPMHPQNTSAQHTSSLYNSPLHENSNSSLFDVVEFPQLTGTEGFYNGYGLNQSFVEGGEGSFNYSPLSPESVYSPTAQSPLYNTNFSTNQNSNECQYQTELPADQWCTTQFSDSPYDFGNNSYESYQPLSPPKSVSPFLKDGQDNNNQFGNLGENENLKESEDLINIIDSVNKTYNTNSKSIPESEFMKLRSVLEGNEDSMRNEMEMYLKSDTHRKPSNNRLDDSSADYPFNFEAPLTPPKSVSPVQGSIFNSSSPIPDFRDIRDLNSYESDEHLIDILHGIDEINPDELNIYLDEDTSASDPSYARTIIQSRCKPNNLDHALRRLSSISTKYLCKKDSDGDTCLMIVYSKPEDSLDFYENIFCLQEKVREIRVCCDVPLGKAKRCKVCGNTDPSKFYTPLSLKNKQGDTALSCTVKTDHSPLIINYLLHGILQCPEDFRRVFDERSRAMLADVAYKYPCLSPYL